MTGNAPRLPPSALNRDLIKWVKAREILTISSEISLQELYPTSSNSYRFWKCSKTYPQDLWLLVSQVSPSYSPSPVVAQAGCTYLPTKSIPENRHILQPHLNHLFEYPFEQSLMSQQHSGSIGRLGNAKKKNLWKERVRHQTMDNTIRCLSGIGPIYQVRPHQTLSQLNPSYKLPQVNSFLRFRKYSFTQNY